MFDTVCKFLIETFPTDFASWLLGEPVELTELSPSELSLEPIRADALLLMQSAETILHVEFQSRPDAAIPFRMADYRLRVYRRFPSKAMRQVVIYLKQTESEWVYETVFEIPRTRHEFDVIRLWEQPVEQFLSEPGLLPFAALAKTDDREAVLREVARRIEQISDRRIESHVAACTGVLAGLSLDEALVQRILRMEIMQDSSVYQAIKAEGRREAQREAQEREALLQREAQEREVLLQREAQEREVLLRREAQEREAQLLLRLLNRRVGSLPEALQRQVMGLSVGQLEDLGEALLDFSGVADLEGWLLGLRQRIEEVLDQLNRQVGVVLRVVEPELAGRVMGLSWMQLDELEGVAAENPGEQMGFKTVADVKSWLERMEGDRALGLA